MRRLHSVAARSFGAAVGTKGEGGGKFVLAAGTVGGANLFEGNHALHFVESRRSATDQVEGVFLHKLHAVVSRERANFIRAAGRAHYRPNRVVK